MSDFQSMTEEDVLEWVKKNFGEEVATKCAGTVSELTSVVCPFTYRINTSLL